MTVRTSDPDILKHLKTHPKVDAEPGASAGIEFGDRRLNVGGEPRGIAGLVELIDNNPLVCAEEATIPPPLATLALIALGPIVQAGILAEPPSIIANIVDDGVGIWLQTIDWSGGATIHTEPLAGAEDIVAVTVLAAIRTPNDLSEIDEIYEERFGRSFFVRRIEDREWAPELVRGEPFGAYQLRITPDEPNSLLSIRVIADPQGKCGAAQAVHAFNVMAGFEESLGVL